FALWIRGYVLSDRLQILADATADRPPAAVLVASGCMDSRLPWNPHVASIPSGVWPLARTAACRCSPYPDPRGDGHQQRGLGRGAPRARRPRFPDPTRTATAGLGAGDRRN